jgi:hypothetical protein
MVGSAARSESQKTVFTVLGSQQKGLHHADSHFRQAPGNIASTRPVATRSLLSTAATTTSARTAPRALLRPRAGSRIWSAETQDPAIDLVRGDTDAKGKVLEGLSRNVTNSLARVRKSRSAPSGSATNILPVPNVLDRTKPCGIRAIGSRPTGLILLEDALVHGYFFRRAAGEHNPQARLRTASWSRCGRGPQTNSINASQGLNGSWAVLTSAQRGLKINRR